MGTHKGEYSVPHSDDGDEVDLVSEPTGNDDLKFERSLRKKHLVAGSNTGEYIGP